MATVVRTKAQPQKETGAPPFSAPRLMVDAEALAATTWVPGRPDTWPGWEDAAVPPEELGDYLRELRKLMDNHDYNPSLYDHFGQGCVHCRVEFDLYTAEGMSDYRSFVGEAADLVVRFGGSLSGEHGDGQTRAELLPKMFGEEEAAHRSSWRTAALIGVGVALGGALIWLWKRNATFED
jgi:FAD/FMN-containing dehydrogenase